MRGTARGGVARGSAAAARGCAVYQGVCVCVLCVCVCVYEMREGERERKGGRERRRKRDGGACFMVASGAFGAERQNIGFL